MTPDEQLDYSGTAVVLRVRPRWKRLPWIYRVYVYLREHGVDRWPAFRLAVNLLRP